MPQRLQVELRADSNKLHRRYVGVFSWADLFARLTTEVEGAPNVSLIRISRKIFRKNGGRGHTRIRR
jgi:hypothetical protein